MKKLKPQSALPVLFVTALIMVFGGGRLAAIGDGIGEELADGSNSQAAGTNLNTENLEGASSCNWRYGETHKMHWPQLPDLGSAGMDVDMSLLFLADDFKCTATGPINDIHIWASFLDDVLPSDGPDSLTFEITIYSDIPATDSSWSMPGDPLWSRTFSPNEYSVRKLDDSPEAWYDPAQELYLPDNHRQAYQYNFCIEEAPFIQERGTIYWLGVEELAPANANYKFGWKTTTHRLRWNDDAVFFLAGKLVSFPLKYPKDHEYMGESLDLAFVITDGEEGDRKHDLGDAPDSSNSFPGATMLAYPAPGVAANYPTVYEIGSPPYGPIHWRPDAMFYLGRIVTNESEADTGYDEDIKNNLVPPKDLSDLDGGDDGVKLPLVLPHCGEAAFDYTVTVLAPDLSMAIVNVWCDWNRDGDWDDVVVCPDGTNVPEWAVQNQQLLFTGPGTLTMTTPPFMCWHPQTDAKLDPMWMRITIAERPWGDVAGGIIHGGAGPAFGYEYGETEDYFIYPKKEGEPLEYDWGDAPDSAAAAGYPTLSTNSGANHVITGPWLGDNNDQPDAELNGQPESNALGDDLDTEPLFSLGPPNDDENGVTIPPLIRGETADIELDVRGGGGILQAWIDFNGDKTWEVAEQIYDGFLPSGAHTISFSVPTSAVVGQTFARFRISRQGGLGPEGPAHDGEVEDYDVFIEEMPKDLKWVQWPDLTRNGIDIRIDNMLQSIADDFECTNNNWITTVSLWGSWKNDNKGNIKQIHLSICSDDPSGPAGQEQDNKFSKPDSILWSMAFSPDDFQEALYHVVRDPGEWWWDPVSGEWTPGGDSEVWRIDISINPDEAFLQQGSPDNPIIYWLKVQVETEDGEFGWKTRQWPDHYMDDAVWEVFFGLLPHNWKELRYPKTHPYHSLEKNSIDMSFQLTYTEEGPPQPTSRPGSATQCQVVQTQCPTVATQCPPLNTQCPVVATQCPAVQTQCVAITMCPPVNTTCPAVATTCPAVQTQCPPVPTECPPIMTRCPPLETRCSLIPTICQGVETQCPAVETYCPPVETMCPAVQTQCPPVPTECPPIMTRCPPLETRCSLIPTICQGVETQCPAIETYCPPVKTMCPAVQTQCPPVPTECPPVFTRCPPLETRCSLVPTICQGVETQCPAVETYCPPVKTMCPAVRTQCPAVPTECPPVLTRCPPLETRCSQVPTICQNVETQCPAIETYCPPVETMCPAVRTQCPPVPTECPPVFTRCPPLETKCSLVPTICQNVETQCPAIETYCPPVKTMCPAVRTQCPAVPTECPPLLTRCPPLETKCSQVPTICQGVETQCPAVETYCPPVKTMCPAVRTQCPAVPTECPPVLTRCPPLETRCSQVPTICQNVETQCPAIETYCPPVETMCPAVRTQCPPVPTECPPVFTRCPPLETRCSQVPTICQNVETQCPAIETYCPPVETMCPAVRTQCPAVPTLCPPSFTRCPPLETRCPPLETRCSLVPTQCPIVATQCPALETYCPPVETVCPAVDTQCPPVDTKCPGEDTVCPVAETRCPPVRTKCPPLETECQAVETVCPVVETKCPITDTKCPVVTTQCPIVPTQCPAVETRCPPEETKCPDICIVTIFPIETRCPGSPTKCPAVDTQCPVVDTTCPAPPTRCLTIETECPAVPTFCPPVETQCPGICIVTMFPIETQCPTERTICPTNPTICPPVETQCPIEQTICPPFCIITMLPIKTRCPESPTNCPAVETQCPVVDTTCPAPPTRCLTIETECPAVPTFCPPVVTQCPGICIVTIFPIETQCPRSSTNCPAVKTQCPVVDTTCPAPPTRCLTIETECPAVPTFCPPNPTFCPPVETQCPATESICSGDICLVTMLPIPTQCPIEPTRCPATESICSGEICLITMFPIETQCPIEQTICPPFCIVTMLPIDTQCPPADTQCPIETTKCPTEVTACPPETTSCPICLITIFGCGFTSFPCIGEGTANPIVMAECPAIDVQAPTVITQRR